MDVVGFRNALDVLLEDASKHRSEFAAESWQGLVQWIQNNSQVEEDIAFVASILLAPEDSLLQFLGKSLEQQGSSCVNQAGQGTFCQCVCLFLSSIDFAAAGKAGSKVRGAIFKYLERFLKELGPDRAHKYCSQVVDTCLFAYKREDSNPAKGATFLPLQCILEWDLPIPDYKSASELVKAYQSSYQRLKSLTGTVKGDILQTLGQLLQAKPQVSKPNLPASPADNPNCIDVCKTLISSAKAVSCGKCFGYMTSACSCIYASLQLSLPTYQPLYCLCDCRVSHRFLGSTTCGFSMNACLCFKPKQRPAGQTRVIWQELLWACPQHWRNVRYPTTI